MLCLAEPSMPGTLTLIGPAWQRLAASCDLKPGDQILLDCLPGQGAVRFQTCKPAMCAPPCCVAFTVVLCSCLAAWQAGASLSPAGLVSGGARVCRRVQPLSKHVHARCHARMDPQPACLGYVAHKQGVSLYLCLCVQTMPHDSSDWDLPSAQLLKTTHERCLATAAPASCLCVQGS